MNKRFYITTAIDYVNGQPHLGQAYEKIIADVVARGAAQPGGGGVLFTGLDEHGKKVSRRRWPKAGKHRHIGTNCCRTGKTFAKGSI